MSREYGSARHPIRVSSLTSLQSCPGFGYLNWLEDNPEMELDGSKAAHTGTAVGLMAELWHRGDDPDTAEGRARVAAMGGFADRPAFPLADLDSATRAFRRYAADPRNARELVLVESMEMTVTLQVPPHPLDPTGEPVHLKGHPDQVRFGPHNTLKVWDLKHSRFEGDDLLRKYAWSQAAYAAACEVHYKRPVTWGGIIRTTGYLTRKAKSTPPDGFRVHFRSPLTRKDCHAALNQMRLRVALIRRGVFNVAPGEFCSWCPAQSFSRCHRELGGDRFDPSLLRS